MTQAADTHARYPTLSSGQYAFFFDVDGTLAAIQSRPEAVFIPEQVIAQLQQLSSLSLAALPLVSGRPIEQLDALAAPRYVPAAAVPGAARLAANGPPQRTSPPD